MSALLGDLYCRREAGGVRFGSAAIDLALAEDGSLEIGAAGRVLARGAGALRFRVGGHRRAEATRDGRRFRYRNIDKVPLLDGAVLVGAAGRIEAVETVLEAAALRVRIARREGGWRWVEEFALAAGSGEVRRAVEIAWCGASAAPPLRDVCFAVPGAGWDDAAGMHLHLPGYPPGPSAVGARPPGALWLADALEADGYGLCGGLTAPGERAGILILRGAADDRCLVAWPANRQEASVPCALREAAGGVALRHYVVAAAHLQPGVAVRVEGQHLAVQASGWRAALAGFHAWYARQGIAYRPPAGRDARREAVYEVHIGCVRFPAGSHAPYPDLAALVADLPRIAALGFTCIDLMPSFPFPGYSLYRLDRPDVQWGGGADLAPLVAAAHRHGLAIVLDMLLHGVQDGAMARAVRDGFSIRRDFFTAWAATPQAERSPYLDEHPQWFLRDEDGAIDCIYTWLFDLAEPSLQDHLLGVLRGLILDLGVDGFRFDAPEWGCSPNWSPGLPHRAGAAYGGGAAFLDRARRELGGLRPGLRFFTENEGPLYRPVCDMTYNYQFWWLWPALAAGTLEAGAVAEWLWGQQRSLPAGSVTLHHLDSHDAWFSDEGARFARERYGEAPARAAAALAAFLGGAFMAYAGAERGSEDFYARILALRRDDPALATGEADFLAVDGGHARVLAIRRGTGAAARVLLVSCTPEAVSAVPTPRAGGADGDSLWAEGVCTDRLDPATTWRPGQALAFAPWQVRVLGRA